METRAQKKRHRAAAQPQEDDHQEENNNSSTSESSDDGAGGYWVSIVEGSLEIDRDKILNKKQEERARKKMAQAAADIRANEQVPESWQLLGIISLVANRTTGQDVEDARKAYAKKKQEEKYPKCGYLTKADDWIYNEDPDFEEKVRLSGPKPIQYLWYRDKDSGKEFYKMFNPTFPFALMNGFVYSCMSCRRLYFVRFMNGRGKCIRCGEEQYQERVTTYGSAC